MSRPLPAGKFSGVPTEPLYLGPLVQVAAPAPPLPWVHQGPSVSRGPCPGCGAAGTATTGRRVGRVVDGEHLRIRRHLHPTTHVECSRSGAFVHDVWDQWTKQPVACRCSCYRG